MRKNTLGILLIVIFIMILIVSCDGTSKLPDVEDSTSEQTQSSLPQTPTLGMSPEDAPEKSSTNIKGENASGIGFSSMEKAYYSKYHELADKYGTHTLYDVKLEYGGHSYLDGVCIVNFMDFNGDGIQDLFVVYSNGQMNRIVIDNYDLEIFDFPAKDTYEIEVWTYKNGELILLLHESCVSVQDSSYYSYHDADELIALYCQFSITVFENEARFPVIQIYNYDERDEVSEYSNIYFSKGKIVRDKLTYKAPVFLMNDSEITWSIWSENVAG